MKIFKISPDIIIVSGNDTAGEILPSCYIQLYARIVARAHIIKTDEIPNKYGEMHPNCTDADETANVAQERGQVPRLRLAERLREQAAVGLYAHGRYVNMRKGEHLVSDTAAATPCGEGAQ